MATCTICCEAFNASTRKLVPCGYCSFEACRSCVAKYLCSTTERPHCMQCRNAWNNTFMFAVMTKSFLTKEYKLHREAVLFDRECSLLPETQPYAEAEVERRKAQAELYELKREARGVQLEQFRVYTRHDKVYNYVLQLHPSATPQEIERFARKDLAPINRELKRLSRRSNELTNTIYRLQNVVRGHGTDANKVSPRVFVRRCPLNDCRGFLDGLWKCGLCDTRACDKCHEPLRDAQPHECNPNDVATARALERETRPCPSCSTRIFKIDGCDQMWCTQCRTAFSWRTGQMETGNIHNPHYIDFLRRTRKGAAAPRDPLDVPCGGIPSYHALMCALTGLGADDATRDFVLNCTRLARHTENVEFAKYRTQGEINNRDLRVCFLLKDMDELAFKRKLQQREKAAARKGEIMEVLTMLVNVTAILLQKLVTALGPSVVADVSKELSVLLEYTDESMAKISLRYGCVTPRFTQGDKVVTIK